MSVHTRSQGDAQGARAPHGENKNWGLTLEGLVVSAPLGRARSQIFEEILLGGGWWERLI